MSRFKKGWRKGGESGGFHVSDWVILGGLFIAIILAWPKEGEMQGLKNLSVAPNFEQNRVVLEGRGTDSRKGSFEASGIVPGHLKGSKNDSHGTFREITAYSSEIGQTDDSPCISADGSDICSLHEKGMRVCAANFVLLGTVLKVGGVDCVIRDRMNPRFKNRVDLYFGQDRASALKFGHQILWVEIK